MKNLGLCIILLAACGSSSRTGDDEGGPDASKSMDDADMWADAGIDSSSPDAFVCTADIQNDQDNCGACGRSCLGAACALGRCTAERIDSGDISGIGDYTTDGLFMYYTGFTTGTGANHRLWKLVIGPTLSPAHITSFAHPTPLSQIAFDGTDFYTAEPVRIDTINRGTVKKINKDPFAETNLAQFQEPTTTAVLQQGGFVYWATDTDRANGGDIKRVATTGGTITTISAVTGFVAYLGADSSNIFWVDDGKTPAAVPALRRAPIGGGANTSVTSVETDFFDMDATRVYMVRKNTGELISVAKTGGAVASLGQGVTAGGAVDDEYVYASKSNKLVAVTKAGADAGTLWEGEPQGTQDCPTTMKITRTKVIGDYVYFLVVPTTCDYVALFNQIHRIARM